MKRGVAARVTAARALQRVLDGGEHSNVVINEVRAPLSPTDGAQVQRIVLGAIRHLSALDNVLERAGRRPVADLDPEVRAVLRTGAAELLVDDGEPHGVVDSAVDAARSMGSGRAAGLVNAVLRRLARERPGLDKKTIPRWINERLKQQMGAGAAKRALESLDEPARRGIRSRSTALPEGADPVEGISGAGYLEAGVAVAEGAVDFIDPASTAVAIAAEAAPGMAVLDVAAAPGGKTAALWDAMGRTGILVAADRHPARLRTARRRLDRMGIDPIWVVADGTAPPFHRERFDVVVLDAPCSGLGSLRRRPEIRHRLDPGDPKRFGELQRRMLNASLALVRPGGRLVYSVCTLFAEETTEVVGGSAARPPQGLPGEASEHGLLLAPHLTGTDGMFISVIDR